MPEMGSYNVAKAGVIALSETLRGELAPLGINVTVLCPTFFESNVMESFRSPEVRQRELAEAFFRAAKVTSDDVAEAALRGLERGEHLVIPQKGGAIMWRMKRFSPALFQRLITSKLRAVVEKSLLRKS